jgi:hypothetical protein
METCAVTQTGAGRGLSPVLWSPTADCRQPTPCYGFRQQLTPGVDRTSAVKSGLPIFWNFFLPFTFVIGVDIQTDGEWASLVQG